MLARQRQDIQRLLQRQQHWGVSRLFPVALVSHVNRSELESIILPCDVVS